MRFRKRDEAGRRTRDILRSRCVDDHPQSFTVMFHPVPEEHFYSYPNKYQYRIPVTGPSNDAVLRVVSRTIAKLNQEHMDVAAVGMYAINLTNSRLWPLQTPETVDVKLYAFKYQKEEVPVTFPLRLLPYTNSLTADRIQVRMPGGTWETLENSIVKQAAKWNPFWPIESQQKWWAKNGKHFELMRLPIEVRHNIYRQAMGGVFFPKIAEMDGRGPEPFLSVQPFLGSWLGISADCSKWKTPSAKYMSRNLLLVSKKVRQETLSAVWVGTTKRFTEPLVLEKCADTPLPPHPHWLTSIHLDMTLFDLFRIFEVNVNPTLHFGSSGGHVYGSILVNMPSLKSLEISVNCPRELEEGRKPDHNPWKIFREESQQHPNMEVKPCFKVAVDWMLMGAFPYIKGIPHVELLGAVKTSLKQKWGYILSQAYVERDRDEEFRSFRWEEEVEELALEGHVITQAPPCTCASSCVRWQMGTIPFDEDD
ncbi:hypothetical protein DM02DRAFT_711294 [Periconia macrospinosa]|uniref:Uncharacterized protein n=1 Tax=Periconia macrospinosa TaxID=97972 RepID=A0A2V1DN18_9PLEO|nr:hypothetical protein DM02DRAFT_711294 [Periconia macrospinosa]